MNIKQIENFIIQKQDILKYFENFKKPDKWEYKNCQNNCANTKAEHCNKL